MHWQHVEQNWAHLKAVLGSTFGKLTAEDLENLSGKRESMVMTVCGRYGCAKDDAERQLDAWARSLPTADIAPTSSPTDP